jgi:tetratricopeptide (TPR) repeat protein
MRFPAEAFRGAPEAENSGLEFERGEMRMNATRRLTGLAIVAALGLILGNELRAFAQAPAAGQDAAAKGPKYTQAEYNAEQACAAEKVPAAVIKCADDFVSKYPNSDLLVYIYPLYYQAYSGQKNYQKMMEIADKLAALGDKIDALTRFNAYFSHATAYYAMVSDSVVGPNASKDAALAKGAQEAAATALKTFEEVKKPDNVTDDAWAKQKTVSQLTLNGIAAQAAMNAKDCSGAVTYYKAALALNPDDLTFNYRLGQAYLCMNPAQQMDAFWSIARAVTAKGATQAQSAKVKDYLRKLIVNYQGGTVCDSLTDAELNELLQLAGTSAERPSSYSLPAAADLAAAQKDMTIASVVADLKAGADKGKLTWLAACGLEFPEVPGKVIEVVKGSDSIVLKIAFVTSDAEFEAATTPNMDVKVAGQPEAARVEKDSAVHFTGTLTSYDPDPAFFLHWDKAKVKEEDIPKEKGAPKRPVRKPAARKPAAKPS